MYVVDLENLMKDCTKLVGKPKVLIIQACQGQAQQDGEFMSLYVSFTAETILQNRIMHVESVIEESARVLQKVTACHMNGRF